MSTTEQSKADVLNAIPGKLGFINCPNCLNRGYAYEMRGEALVTVECTCVVKRRSLRLIRNSGLSDSLERCTFEAYQTPEAWQQKAKEKALAFAEQPKGWFVVTGAVGSGKTHLCTAIAGAMIHKGYDLRYMAWRRHAPRLKGLINSPDEYDRDLGPLINAKVLYIDDLWKGSVTEADKNLAFALLDSRYSDTGKITVISSERTLEEMLAIDEAIGSRICERAGTKLRIDGGNWRLKHG